MPPEAFHRLRQRVAELLLSMTAHSAHDSDPAAAEHHRLKRALEQALTEQWADFTDEQRVRIYFPGVRPIGEQVELPQRGTATIIRHELSPRFGLFVTYRLADGSVFRWEHFD
jgi:hypothetical protein